MIALSVLALIPASALAQQDLKCDVTKVQDYLDCSDLQFKTYLGKYLCVIDHVAGIQYDDELGNTRPFVGRIKPTEDKFFMEIAEDSSLECGSIWPAATQTKDCRTKYKMTVKSKSIFLRENGYSALLPQTFVTTGGQMVIVAGGRFNGNYRFGWDSYAFEGRCEKLN